MTRAQPLRDLAETTFDAVEIALAGKPRRLTATEVGTVVEVSTGTAEIRNLQQVAANELLRFPNGLLGIAADVELGRCGAILLGRTEGLSAGDDVRRTHRVVDTFVGDALLGRVIDPLGRPLDGKGTIKTITRWPVEREAPAIMDRAAVSVPLHTGIKVIDAAIPIGRGQRELIVGDRQTGKTAIAIDTIINQSRDVICVYCAIGQRGDAVARVVDKLERTGAIDTTITVVASGEDPPGLQFIAPYAATSMAEWFMERGRDVLIVYDDLTRHGRAYRELSLLLRRPPAREAYPGDIFYIHSRLLERSTRLRKSKGGGSLTALPIIETQAQNLSAYIPTNLISITDGQIYLSPTLFQRSQLPAVDIGKSVSRVGGRAQLPALREVSGPLKLAYSQFEELEAFARFGSRLDEDIRRMLERGRRVREALKQAETAPLTLLEQVAVLAAVTEGLCDHIPLHRIAEAELAIRNRAQRELTVVADAIGRGAPLEAHQETLLSVARAAISASGLAPDKA